MQADIKGLNDSVTSRYFYLAVMLCMILLSNGIYLALIDFVENIWLVSIQNRAYQYMFAVHLLIGVLALLVTAIYVFRHGRRAARGGSSIAAKHGKRLVAVIIIIFVTGVLLTRGIVSFEVIDRNLRILFYLLHIALPILAIFIYRVHRRAGNNNRQISLKMLAIMLAIFSMGPLIAHVEVNGQVSKSNGEVQTFLPSLIKVNSEKNLTSRQLMLTEYCRECHKDSHERWRHSAHRYSSFNNPFYRVSVENLRQKLNDKGADTRGTRFCAGCHDPVPLLSGEFDNSDFELDNYASASAGLTCTVCHSFSTIDSPRGNADFTITPPEHYPFAFSESKILRWFSELLIKSNPDFHKRTFLKPLHTTPEFCGTCHKVHIPPEINNYKWLRGQNHYDSFLLSGVSGHSVSSYYYPAKAVSRCASCHMQPVASNEFGARLNDEEILNGNRYLHDHLFPAANTAITNELESDNAEVIKNKSEFLERAATVDIIGLRKDGRTDGELISPLEGSDVQLKPGSSYLLEVVIRTTGVGHEFTQGTADSNQVWLQIEIVNNGKVLAESGSLDITTGELSIGSHMVNAYLIDMQGNKINRRNGEDIYTTLYNNQIPPGAADAIHYLFTVPDGVEGDVDISAALKYRKFDNNYYRLSTGKINNPLTVTVIDKDEVALPTGESSVAHIEKTKKAVWERLNDYGIGLLRKSGKSQYRQAEEVFRRVEAMGRQEGALNLVRLYYLEGRLEEAADVLNIIDYSKLDNPWTATWFTALIDRDNGFLDEAIVLFEKLINTEWQTARSRGFDFSKDYRLLNTYAATLLTRARTDKNNSENTVLDINKAKKLYQKVLSIDPENVSAHYGMMQISRQIGDAEQAEYHQGKHAYYKVDDSARERAIGLAREKDPYADLTSKSVVVYELINKK